jgi:accessory gene regulator protein AgrB
MFLLTTFHVQEETYNNWMNVATMIFGVLAVFTAEGAPESKIEGFSK